MNAAIPISFAIRSERASPNPVQQTIGIEGRIFFASRASSSPSMPGIAKSVSSSAMGNEVSAIDISACFGAAQAMTS